MGIQEVDKAGITNLSSFTWSIAEILRGDFNQFMPMSGVHKALHRTPESIVAFRGARGGAGERARYAQKS